MSAAKVKVAIIEDDVSIVQMYKTKFTQSGYEVETAGDGITGLQLINRFKPDVILLDLMMPNMDGFDMLSSLRHQARGDEAKVIVLTNMGDAETATKLIKLSADDYIVKAEMTPSQVEERVQKLLKAKS